MLRHALQVELRGPGLLGFCEATFTEQRANIGTLSLQRKCFAQSRCVAPFSCSKGALFFDKNLSRGRAQLDGLLWRVRKSELRSPGLRTIRHVRVCAHATFRMLKCRQALDE